MWGIIPAAGQGSRIQPLAFSKELLPVGSRWDGEVERPRAVSEYIIERMLLAGVDKLCVVISPGKTDIVEYFGGSIGGATITYLVQTQPLGLCDAIFRASSIIDLEEHVVIGLPDTIWFPRDALAWLPNNGLSFLLFPVEHPDLFDSVSIDERNRVKSIQVKSRNPASPWIWGAFKSPARILRELREAWLAVSPRVQFVGDVVNRYLERGGLAIGIQAGSSYVDVGTVHGYHEAIRLLSGASDCADGKH